MEPARALAQAIEHARAESALNAETEQSEETCLWSPDRRGAILGALNRFETVFETELPRLNLYAVPTRRAYYSDVLLDNAEQAFAPSVRRLLSKAQGRLDVREAGRCIAFGQWTSAGFHLFRAVEIFLLKYFPALSVPAPTKRSQRNLGNYLTLLKASDKLDGRIYALLDHLRSEYRNPIMHPEIFLEEDEALNLFGFVQSVLSAVAVDLLKLSADIPDLPDPERPEDE